MTIAQWMLLVAWFIVLQHLAGLVPSFGKLWDWLLWILLMLLIALCLLGKLPH